MKKYDFKTEYPQLKKRVRLANKRIRAIEKRYGKESWAINQLYEKINTDKVRGINKRGLIRTNKTMSTAQLRNIEQATNRFLHNKTSKLTGIEEVIRDVKNTLRTRFGEPSKPMSWRDINKLYDLVEDKEKRDITEKMGASDVWYALDQSKQTNLKFDKFFDLLNDKIELDIKDPDDVKFLVDIYSNYTNKKKEDIINELEIVKNKTGISDINDLL